MATPQSVAERAKKADEFINSMKRDPGEPAADQPVDQEQQGPAPVTEDPAAGTEVQPDSTGVEHDWKKRFSLLQNTHANTVAELKQARAESAAREAELKARLDDLEAEASQTQAKDRSYLSEDELTLFGEDNLDLVERVAEQIAERKLAAIEQQRKRDQERQEAERLAASAASEKANDFKTRIRNAVADFDKIDTDPNFEAWLREVDAHSGVPRGELFRRAYESSDVGRVASFYSEFVDLARKRDPRENLVQPKPAGTPPASQDTGRGEIWTVSKMNHFYNVIKPALLKTDPERARAMEADIYAAQREGRFQR